ncbi:MAG TPA: hypothetical protein VGV87_09585 [Blastocatellia bacterium]|nr:hypothetical protein [Blastocatellia bacterium]
MISVTSSELVALSQAGGVPVTHLSFSAAATNWASMALALTGATLKK